MCDLIERQAAIEEMQNMYHAAEKWGQEATEELIKARAESCMSTLVEMKLRVDKLPSAQPELTLESAIDYLHSIGWMQNHDRILTESAQPERKKGKWEKQRETYYPWSCPWSCSVCKEIVVAMPERMGYPLYDYCPNCGANMRGGGAE